MHLKKWSTTRQLIYTINVLTCVSVYLRSCVRGRLQEHVHVHERYSEHFTPNVNKILITLNIVVLAIRKSPNTKITFKIMTQVI